MVNKQTSSAFQSTRSNVCFTAMASEHSTVPSMLAFRVRTLPAGNARAYVVAQPKIGPRATTCVPVAAPAQATAETSPW